MSTQKSNRSKTRGKNPAYQPEQTSQLLPKTKGKAIQDLSFIPSQLSENDPNFLLTKRPFKPPTVLFPQLLKDLPLYANPPPP